MNTYMNKHLVKIVAEMSIFLEFTDRSLLDEDVAVQALEQLAAELQLMTEGELKDLSFQLQTLSASYEDKNESEFIRNLFESLGLE